MALEINTRYTEKKILAPGVTVSRETEKSKEQFSVEIAEAAVAAAVKTGGRIAQLASELTEAEALMELGERKFKLSMFEFEDNSKKWLTETRQWRMAMDAEFRQATKTLSDIVEYLARPEVQQAVAQMRELCAVAEQLKALNKDGGIERLIDAVLTRTET